MTRSATISRQLAKALATPYKKGFCRGCAYDVKRRGEGWCRHPDILECNGGIKEPNWAILGPCCGRKERHA